METVYAGFTAEGEVTGNYWWAECVCWWWCNTCSKISLCVKVRMIMFLRYKCCYLPCCIGFPFGLFLVCLSVCLYSWPTVHVRGGSELCLHPWRLQYYFCWLLCNLAAVLWGWPTWCIAVDTRREHTWHCVLSGVWVCECRKCMRVCLCINWQVHSQSRLCITMYIAMLVSITTVWIKL